MDFYDTQGQAKPVLSSSRLNVDSDEEQRVQLVSSNLMNSSVGDEQRKRFMRDAGDYGYAKTSHIPEASKKEEDGDLKEMLRESLKSATPTTSNE